MFFQLSQSDMPRFEDCNCQYNQKQKMLIFGPRKGGGVNQGITQIAPQLCSKPLDRDANITSQLCHFYNGYIYWRPECSRIVIQGQFSIQDNLLSSTYVQMLWEGTICCPVRTYRCYGKGQLLSSTQVQMLWEGTFCCPVRTYNCYGKGQFVVQYVNIIVIERDNLLSSTYV